MHLSNGRLKLGSPTVGQLVDFLAVNPIPMEALTTRCHEVGVSGSMASEASISAFLGGVQAIFSRD